MFVGVVAAAVVALQVSASTGFIGREALSMWGLITAGPFAGVWLLPAEQQVACIGTGMVNFLVLLVHPMRPNTATALLTAGATAFWFISGAAIVLSVG